MNSEFITKLKEKFGESDLGRLANSNIFVPKPSLEGEIFVFAKQCGLVYREVGPGFLPVYPSNYTRLGITDNNVGISPVFLNEPDVDRMPLLLSLLKTLTRDQQMRKTDQNMLAFGSNPTFVFPNRCDMQMLLATTNLIYRNPQPSSFTSYVSPFPSQKDLPPGHAITLISDLHHIRDCPAHMQILHDLGYPDDCWRTTRIDPPFERYEKHYYFNNEADVWTGGEPKTRNVFHYVKQ